MSGGWVLVSVRHELVLVKDRDKVFVRLSTMKGNQGKVLISIDEQMCEWVCVLLLVTDPGTGGKII